MMILFSLRLLLLFAEYGCYLLLVLMLLPYDGLLLVFPKSECQVREGKHIREVISETEKERERIHEDSFLILSLFTFHCVFLLPFAFLSSLFSSAASKQRAESMSGAVKHLSMNIYPSMSSRLQPTPSNKTQTFTSSIHTSRFHSF